MGIDPGDRHRKTIRLQQHDYRSAGGYYVTICTHQRACTLGEVVNGEALVSAWGDVVRQEWQRTAELRPYVVLDVFVIMPNHLHGILLLKNENEGAANDKALSIQTGHGSAVSLRSGEGEADPERYGRPTKGSLHAIMRSFKSVVTRRIREIEGDSSLIIWQGRFYEHVIRD